MPNADRPGGRVLVFSPTGRDAALMGTVLDRAGIIVTVVQDVTAMMDSLAETDAVIVADEVLTESACECLRVVLECQPVWSDLPMVVLASPNSSSRVELFAKLSPAANITLIERPASPFTLITVTRAALRARRRQYLTRNHLAELVEAREEIGRHRDKLAEARTRLESTLTAAEIGTWMWDVRTGLIAGDRNLARFFDLDEAEAARGGVGTYMDRLHPDDRGRLETEISDAMGSRESFESEFRIIQTDGTVRWVLARGRVLRDLNGAAVSMPGAVVDITERIQSERARRGLTEELERQSRMFDTMLSATPDFAYIMNTDNRFLYANRSLLRLWGMGLDEVVHRTFTDVGYTPEQAARLNRQVDDVFSTGQEVRDETEYTSPSGVWGYHEYILAPVRTADGRVEVVVGSTRNISQRKLLDDQRGELLASERSARAEAERVGRLKDEFLSTLSHELRTPLNAISGWVQLLRRGNLSEADRVKAIETISRNTQSQKELIEDLLDMSRIVSGKVRLDVQSIDLGVVVCEAVESVRPAAEVKDITLTTVMDPPDTSVRGDAARLQQVVWNLVNNAVKFTPKGGGVRVEMHRGESEVEISVSDTGIGIAAEFLPQVFDRFRQGDASSTRRHGGLGLGLSIVKQIVEMHGGQVSVSSPGEGRGSTFRVVLPAGLAVGDAPPPPRPSAAAQGLSGYEPAALAGVTVLVVDDDPDGREIVQRILEESQARVLTADSADAADVVLEGSHVDVLLSDIGMPLRDGYDLIRTLRASGRARLRCLPAAALTAFARSEDRAAAMRAGYDSHITKPVEPAELLAVVERLRRRDGRVGDPVTTEPERLNGGS